MAFNIKNIRNLSIPKGLLKDRKSATTDELLPLIRQALKELDVSYNDTCCGDANLGYGGCPQCTNNFAGFYDTTNQTGASDTVLTMKLNSAELFNSGTITVTNNTLGDPTRITFSNPGVYDIQFSAQMVKEAGNSSTYAHIWLSKNGTDIPWSNSQINFPANSVYIVAAWNWFVEITAPGQYCEIKWHIHSNQNNAVVIESNPATVGPGDPQIPGLIVTVNQVG